MTHGLKCWDSAGRLTFDINIRTIRSTIVQTINHNETGSIALSSLPSGLDGVGFVAVDQTRGNNLGPFTWSSGGRLHWRGGVNAHYLVVNDISGLGGNTSFDGST